MYRSFSQPGTSSGKSADIVYLSMNLLFTGGDHFIAGNHGDGKPACGLIYPSIRDAADVEKLPIRASQYGSRLVRIRGLPMDAAALPPLACTFSAVLAVLSASSRIMTKVVSPVFAFVSGALCHIRPLQRRPQDRDHHIRGTIPDAAGNKYF